MHNIEDKTFSGVCANRENALKFWMFMCVARDSMDARKSNMKTKRRRYGEV